MATRRRGRGKPRRWGRTLLVLLLLAGAGLGAWLAVTWPDVTALRRGPPATTAFIELYRARQRAAGRPAKVQWVVVPYEAIAPPLKRAVLVAEDINFFTHRGFDLSAIREALEDAVAEGEAPRGASTITQQLAKNLWLSPSRNPLRKAKEALLTWQLERTLGKRRILELYLNVVELGPGVFGAEAAARQYFGKPAAALTVEEAAQLAASLPMPSRWHPGSPGRGYQRHVASILRRMEKAEFLRRQI
jgi:monofunctional biosynthetic peptidoglycan transglycosylase